MKNVNELFDIHFIISTKNLGVKSLRIEVFIIFEKKKKKLFSLFFFFKGRNLIIYDLIYFLYSKLIYNRILHII